MEGKILQPHELAAVAQLPTKEVLISMLLSAMQGPIRGVVYTLGAVLTKFVRVIAAIQDKRKGEGDMPATEGKLSQDELIKAIETIKITRTVATTTPSARGRASVAVAALAALQRRPTPCGCSYRRRRAPVRPFRRASGRAVATGPRRAPAPAARRAAHRRRRAARARPSAERGSREDDVNSSLGSIG